MNRPTLQTKLYRVASLLLAVGFLVLPAARAGADVSPDELKSIIYQTPFYDPDYVPACGGGTSPGASASVNISQNIPNDGPAYYRDTIAKAAGMFKADPNLIAATFYWENRSFPPANKKWATSDQGAQGPMQFMPGTWNAFKTDMDGNGVPEINSIPDAFASAAKMYGSDEYAGKAGYSLGTLDKPLAKGTLLRAAAAYNAGSGTVAGWGESASLNDITKPETRAYVEAVYALLSSDFKNLPADSKTSSGKSTSVSSTSSSPCGSTALGKGTGKFTDNTSIRFKGVDKMLSTAKAVSDLKSQTFAQICKVQGPKNCWHWCDYLAANVWGIKASGYESAYVHWQTMVAKGVAHPGDRNPPVGASLFYTPKAPGHIATYLGNNLVLSNDVGDRKSGVKGGAYIVPASEMETGTWNLQYLGWAPPIFNGTTIPTE